jgi:flagellar biosynthesis GTPase FlhF
MGYAIIRTAKLTTYGNLSASGQHTYREKHTPNADAERTHLNADLRPVRSSAALVEAVRERVALADEKHKTKPVLAIEYLITASPEFFANNDGAKYFADAMKWLEDRHGAENIVCANIQRDEKSPHLVAYVVPLVTKAERTRKRSVIVGTNPDGTKRRESRDFVEAGSTKLSAAHFIDGRVKLGRMQTEFAKVVGTPHGLQRGLPGSKANHVTVKQYYTRVNAAFKPFPKVTTRPVKDRPEPAKPVWPFGEAMEAWRKDHAQWEREQAQRAKRAAEVQAQRNEAADRAREYEAKAAEAAALKAETKRLNALAVKAETERDQITQQAATFAAELDLFTPAERARAKERRAEQMREQARLAEQERQAEQQRQEQAKHDQERQRRAENLPRLVKTAGGALATFATKARAALQAVAGDWRRINWRGLEDESLREAITRNKQEPRQAIADVLAHSPGAVTPDEARRRKNELDATVGRLRPSHGPKNGNDYDRGPRGP